MKKGLTLFYLLILIVTSSTIAQDFEVAPVVMNFNANPGEIQQQKLTIRNHANIKQAFTFNVGDFEVGADGQKKRLPGGTSKRSLANWISISPSLLELNPNEEREVTVTMTVPKDGYSSKWGMIYVQTSTEQTDTPVDKQLSTGIKITPRIVVLVNQSPKVNNKYLAKIGNLKEVTTPKDSAQTFTVQVLNVGDKIVEANVHLELANLTTASQQKLKGNMERVYPGERRTFTLTIPNNLPPGKYNLAAILDYGHGSNLEGTQITIEVK